MPMQISLDFHVIASPGGDCLVCIYVCGVPSHVRAYSLLYGYKKVQTIYSAAKALQSACASIPVDTPCLVESAYVPYR